MYRIIQLLLLCCSLLTLSAEESRPNIIFIIADDLGIGDLGSYGATKIKTPNLDRMASEGLRALDAHSSASVCTPSRYGILTGRNYWRIKTNWIGEMLVEEDRPTVAKTLLAAGYQTAYFGKWHLGWGENDPKTPRAHRSDIQWNTEKLPRGVMECGYQSYFGTPFSANEPPLVFVEDRKVVGYDPADPLILVDPKVEKYYGYGTSKGAKAAHEARPLDQIDSIVCTRAADYIQKNKEKPFYMHVSLVSPHVPIAPSKEFINTSQASRYGDYVQQMDAQVGKILEAVEKAGIADKTILFFTSDNGAILHKDARDKGHLSNGDLLGQKCDNWEGGVNIPLIVRWPGKIKPGTLRKQLISLNDFYATACAIAQVDFPMDKVPDSLNQLPVLLEEKSNSIRNEMTTLAITKPQIALRSESWVYIPGQGSSGVTTDPKMTWAMQFEEAGFQNSDYDEKGLIKAGANAVQLYNLKEDPNQHTNLAEKNPEKIKVLDQRLKDILNEKK